MSQENSIPILTIAVPTYNGARTIGVMLDNLLPQVTPEVEVIISDNCSTDDTANIVLGYCQKYSFIKFIQNETNVGADSNFLKCMQNASGRYVMLISDDDVIVDGAVEKILGFLKINSDVSFVYLDSVAFKDNYVDVENCHRYKEFSHVIEEDKVVTDKKEFLYYAQRLFGFTSCHVWSTERIRRIENPEQYMGTYFMQTYISVLCSCKAEDKLGLIAGPCIAVGEYGVLGNYDLAQVEGLYYHKLVEFAVRNSYPKREFEKYYIWKIIHLGRIYLIKERAIKVNKMKLSNLYLATWRYPSAWIKLYPFFLLPTPICRIIVRAVRKRQGRNFTTYVNRPTE